MASIYEYFSIQNVSTKGPLTLKFEAIPLLNLVLHIFPQWQPCWILKYLDISEYIFPWCDIPLCICIKGNVIHSTLLSNIFYMLNTFSMYQIYEKNTSYWQPSWICKMGKMKNYPSYVKIYHFYILCPNTAIIKQISRNYMSYVYDSIPDCVLQQLIKIIYAN